jgi:hypothetical protein
MNYSSVGCRVSSRLFERFRFRHPRMCLSRLQMIRTRLDSPLKTCGNDEYRKRQARGTNPLRFKCRDPGFSKHDRLLDRVRPIVLSF